MTVGTSPTWIDIPGNGTATVFSFPFLITAASDLRVGFIANGVYTSQPSGYSISGVGNAGGGQVTFPVAPPVGTMVDLRSAIPFTQPTNFSNLGPYLPENTTNSVDRATSLVKILARQAYFFGIHGPDQESVQWPALPAPSSRAGMALIFDSNGLPTLGIPVTGTISTGTLAPFLNLAQTQAESAAGVTPVLMQYAAGNILRYGASTSSPDIGAALQAAINQATWGGAPVYVPAGCYNQITPVFLTANANGGSNIASSQRQPAPAVRIYGDGMFASSIRTTQDIEQIGTLGANSSNYLYGVLIRDIAFISAFPIVGTQGTTHHQIHLQNPLLCKLERVFLLGCFVGAGTVGNLTNHAGVWFDNQGFVDVFLNEVIASWIESGHVTIDTSDTFVRDCVLYGTGTDYCVKINNDDVTVRGSLDINGINAGHGAIWITAGQANCKVLENFFDEETSIGVFSDSSAFNNMISDNIFWQNSGAPIYLNNPSFFTIQGNQFLDCGRSDTSVLATSDIVLSCSTSASFNNISGNTHFRTQARVNQCYAVYEFNNGVNPNGNLISNCAITDNGGNQYATPAIFIAGGGGSPLTIVSNCVGKGTEGITAASAAGKMGTFTPVFQGSTTAGANTYSSQVGRFKVIGNMCFFQINLAMSSKDGAMAGNVQIGNLPFFVGPSAMASATVGAKSAITVTFTSLATISNPGTNNIRLGQYGASNDYADLAVSALANTSAINLTGFYNLD